MSVIAKASSPGGDVCLVMPDENDRGKVVVIYGRPPNARTTKRINREKLRDFLTKFQEGKIK